MRRLFSPAASFAVTEPSSCSDCIEFVRYVIWVMCCVDGDVDDDRHPCYGGESLSSNVHATGDRAARPCQLDGLHTAPAE